MKHPRALIIGDSHAEAIKRGLASMKLPEGIDIRAYRQFKLKDDKRLGDVSVDDFLRLCDELGPEDLLVSVLGGNQYNAFGLVQHPQAFDFHCPDWPLLPPLAGHEPIPYRVLLDYFVSAYRGKDGGLLENIVSKTAAKVVCCCPPPPKEDSQLILKRHETLFVQQGLLDRGVTSASIRLKLWSTQWAALRVVAGKLGCEAWPVPPGCQTSAGFLDSRFSADDATHGNEAYGRLVVEQIAERLTQQTASIP